MPYKERIQFLQRLQLILLIICVAALAFFIYTRTRPTVTAHVVRDECGPIGGTLSHPIDDDDSCRNACNAYCQSLQQKIYDSKFTPQDNQCNKCDCFCRKI